MLVSSLSVFRRHVIPALAVLAGCVSGASSLAADPLDKPACDRLQAEKQTLVVLGVDKEYTKGPEWAKANLAPSELNLLKRYIDLDEQLKFRCGLAMVTLQIPDEPEDGPDDDSAPGAANGAVPLPERRDAALAKPAAKPAIAPVKTQPAAAKPSAATPPAAAPAKAAPKSAPKSQSSWSTQTAPTEAASPSDVEQIEVAPKRDRRRPIETGG
jgi:hypothetical protein